MNEFMSKLLLRTGVTVLGLLFSLAVYANVRDDVGRGLPLPVVISNGLDAGKAIETVVTEAINAGADPVAVVRAAIAVRPSLAPVIVNAALKLRRELAATLLKVVLSIPRIEPSSVILAAATAVAGDPQAVANLRFAALEAGVSQSVVDQAIGAAAGTPAGPVPTPSVGTTERGDYGGGQGQGQGPVASPWR